MSQALPSYRDIYTVAAKTGHDPRTITRIAKGKVFTRDFRSTREIVAAFAELGFDFSSALPLGGAAK